MTEPVAWRWGQKLLSGRVHWTYTIVKTRKTSIPMFDQAAIDAAVAAERERCAALCDGLVPVIEASSNGVRRDAALAAVWSCARIIRENT
jgi:hypothetical protein